MGFLLPGGWNVVEYLGKIVARPVRGRRQAEGAGELKPAGPAAPSFHAPRVDPRRSSPPEERGRQSGRIRRAAPVFPFTHWETDSSVEEKFACAPSTPRW